MKHTIAALAVTLVISLLSSCNDSAGVGSSLAPEQVVIVVDSNFTVSASTLENKVVQSRTLSQLVGAIDARGFGSIRSNFTGQFMPSLALDTVNILPADIDSVKMFMQMVRGNFVGDSLIPMGVEVYPLIKDLPYPIYSDFDPQGYYDPTPICGGVYTASSINEPDSISSLDNIYIMMDMPVEFGRNLMQKYIDNPATFADPEVFAREVFKGVYIKSSYGAGRISDFSSTSIRLYYDKEVYNTDSARYETKHYAGDYLAVTPEVVVNNCITYTPAQELKSMAASGKAILAAPAGYEAELVFPAPEILASYNKYADKLRVLNTLTFKLPVEEIENEHKIAPPPYVLLVLKSKKDEFFAKNSLADDKTSFYAAYNAVDRCYTFSGMRGYLLDLLEKASVTPDDYTFVVTPVQVNTEAAANSSYYYGTGSTIVSSIVPYVSKPAMCRLLPDKAQIKLTFSAAQNAE